MFNSSDYANNTDLWYNLFYEDKELINYINDRIKQKRT